MMVCPKQSDTNCARSETVRRGLPVLPSITSCLLLSIANNKAVSTPDTPVDFLNHHFSSGATILPGIQPDNFLQDALLQAGMAPENHPGDHSVLTARLECKRTGYNTHCRIDPPPFFPDTHYQAGQPWGFGTLMPECKFHLNPDADLPQIFSLLPERCLLYLSPGHYHYSQMPVLKAQQSLHAETGLDHWGLAHTTLLFAAQPSGFYYQPSAHPEPAPLRITGWQYSTWLNKPVPVLNPQDDFSWPYALVLGRKSCLEGIAIELPHDRLESILALTDSSYSKVSIKNLSVASSLDVDITAPRHGSRSSMIINNSGGQPTPWQHPEPEQQPESDNNAEGEAAPEGSDLPSGLPRQGSTSSSPTLSGQSAAGEEPPDDGDGDDSQGASAISENPLLQAIMNYLLSCPPHEFWNRLQALLAWIKHHSGNRAVEQFIQELQEQFNISLDTSDLNETPPFDQIELLHNLLNQNPATFTGPFQTLVVDLNGEVQINLLNVLLQFQDQQSDMAADHGFLAQLEELLPEHLLATNLFELVQHFSSQPALLNALAEAVSIHTGETIDSSRLLKLLSMSSSAARLSDKITESGGGLGNFQELLTQKLDAQQQLVRAAIQLFLHPYALAQVQVQEPEVEASNFLLDGPPSQEPLSLLQLVDWFDVNDFDVRLLKLIQIFRRNPTLLRFLIETMDESFTPYGSYLFTSENLPLPTENSVTMVLFLNSINTLPAEQFAFINALFEKLAEHELLTTSGLVNLFSVNQGHRQQPSPENTMAVLGGEQELQTWLEKIRPDGTAPDDPTAAEIANYLWAGESIDELLQRIQLLAWLLHRLDPGGQSAAHLADWINTTFTSLISFIEDDLSASELLLGPAPVTLAHFINLEGNKHRQEFEKVLFRSLRNGLGKTANNILRLLRQTRLSDFDQVAAAICHCIFQQRLTSWLATADQSLVSNHRHHLEVLLEMLGRPGLIKNLQKLLSSGTNPDQTPFFVSPLWRGIDLQEQLWTVGLDWLFQHLSLEEQKQLLELWQMSENLVSQQDLLLEMLTVLLVQPTDGLTSHFLIQLVYALNTNNIPNGHLWVGDTFLDKTEPELKEISFKDLIAFIHRRSISRELIFDSDNDRSRFLEFVWKLPETSLAALLTWARNQLSQAGLLSAPLKRKYRQLSSGDAPAPVSFETQFSISSGSSISSTRDSGLGSRSLSTASGSSGKEESASSSSGDRQNRLLSSAERQSTTAAQQKKKRDAPYEDVYRRRVLTRPLAIMLPPLAQHTGEVARDHAQLEEHMSQHLAVLWGSSHALYWEVYELLSAIAPLNQSHNLDSDVERLAGEILWLLKAQVQVDQTQQEWVEALMTVLPHAENHLMLQGEIRLSTPDTSTWELPINLADEPDSSFSINLLQRALRTFFKKSGSRRALALALLALLPAKALEQWTVDLELTYPRVRRKPKSAPMHARQLSFGGSGKPEKTQPEAQQASQSNRFRARFAKLLTFKAARNKPVKRQAATAGIAAALDSEATTASSTQLLAQATELAPFSPELLNALPEILQDQSFLVQVSNLLLPHLDELVDLL
ncbi:MAG: hypothetical protein ACR2PT_14480, partial [Endozoicomonas sp.]